MQGLSAFFVVPDNNTSFHRCQQGENKLRAYPQIFSLYLQIGNIDSAMHLFEKMKKEHDTVPVEPEFFVQLIASLAEKGYFRNVFDSPIQLQECAFLLMYLHFFVTSAWAQRLLVPQLRWGTLPHQGPPSLIKWLKK